MHRVKPLPGNLVRRYHGWKATTHAENEAWYKKLADEGQRPRAMVIACCDSRVNVLSILGGEHGEFFIHRNIANLVPPFRDDGGPHGTSAAIEYAVTVLKVPHIIVVGHSHCGGVAGCRDMCEGKAPALEEPSSHVGRWIDALRDGHARIAHIEDEGERTTAFEKEGVLVSLQNLLTFPYVAAAVDAGALNIHGCWNDISTGALEVYDAAEEAFQPV